MLTSWFHLIALVAYVGAIIGLWIILLPSLSVIERHDERARFLARGLKLYSPLQVGALGISVISGAFQLTELKAAYREMFVQQLGLNLGIKLLLAFFLIIFSVYQTMGIAHRYVKRYEGGDSITSEELVLIIGRLKSANWIILILALVTLWAGLRLRW